MIRLTAVTMAAALAAGSSARHSAPSISSPAPTPAPAAAPSHADAAPQQDFHWTQRMNPGDQIAVKGIVGDIRAEPSTGGEVTVDAVKRGADAREVRIEVVRRSQGYVVCAIYPHDDDDGWNSHRRDGDGDGDEPRDACSQLGGGGRDIHASVDFTVHVPAGVRFAATTVSGDVYADRLRSPVRAASVSGDVHVQTYGPVQASSVSGDVTADVGRGGEEMEFRSVSGNVSLRLPANVDADLQARTISGEIESDFPLTMDSMARRSEDREERGGFVRVNVRVGHEAHGRLGRGGSELKITTVSGDITVRRAR